LSREGDKTDKLTPISFWGYSNAIGIFAKLIGADEYVFASVKAIGRMVFPPN
jgi:tryptophan synthase beta subunit